jgi:ABC-type Fe3+ transport system permease subunit
MFRGLSFAAVVGLVIFTLCLFVLAIGLEVNTLVYGYTAEQKESYKPGILNNSIWASAYLVPIASMVAFITFTPYYLLPEYGIEKYSVSPITDDKDLDA